MPGRGLLRRWLPTSRNCLRLLLGTWALAGFYAMSQYNYLLFHTLVEVFAVIVACAVFMLFWNSRRFLDNGFFLFIGIACLFAGILDLAHALTYQGMSVLPGASGDDSIQLKTAGRWISGLSFLIAPLFLRRRFNSSTTMAVFTAIVAVVLCLIFGDVLPDNYVEEIGMTTFQQTSRGGSCAVFLAAAGFLVARRRDLDTRVFRLLLASLLTGAASEFASALATDFYGSLKVFAHLSEVVSLYLIYKAFIEVGLTKPYDLVFRSFKQSEEELQRQQQFLKVVLDGVQAGIVACDARGTLTLFNRASREFHGLPQQPISAAQWSEHYDLYLPDGRTRMRTADIPLYRALRDEDVRDVEMMIIPEDGPVRTVLASGRTLLGRDGSKTGAVVVMHDITQRKQAQECLERAKQAAESATRAKSEFLANMSHEIRTPMTAILGYADILADSVDRPEQQEAIQTIQRNSDHLLVLINDILDLSKIEVGKLQVEHLPTCPLAILADVVSLMRVRALAKGLPLKLEYSGPIPQTIQIDPTRLRQILVNLVGNAIKFTEIGEVKIAVRLVDRDTAEPKLQCEVIDTGVGMSPCHLERLFQPFQQADTSTTRKFGGTGLGLVISKRLAALLGGDIAASSALGKGSIFTLTVATGPLEGTALLDQPTEAIAQIVTKPKPATAHRTRLDCRILLAEDGPDNQRLIAFVLRKAGAEVEIAEDGRKAMEKVLATFPGWGRRYDDPQELFDLILMDMQMPVMDGYESTRRLRQQGYKGPIIALTAHAMVEDGQKCLDAGCDDYLPKPFEHRALLEMVSRHITAAKEDEPLLPDGRTR